MLQVNWGIENCINDLRTPFLHAQFVRGGKTQKKTLRLRDGYHPTETQGFAKIRDQIVTAHKVNVSLL